MMEMATQSTKRRIGILGGMGPEATVLLMSRIIASTPAEDDCDHVPLLVDCNTQVPSRIKALLEKSDDDPAPVLADMARRLEAAGATALAMPCNTAHFYAPQIESSVSIPLLNMIELAADQAAALMKARQGKPATVGILASPAVQLTGVFDQAFSRRGVSTAYPSDQDSMLSAIKAIKRGIHADAISRMRNAAIELQERGIEVVLIACTELSLIPEGIPAGMDVIDTIDVLSTAVVDFASDSSS